MRLVSNERRGRERPHRGHRPPDARRATLVAIVHLAHQTILVRSGSPVHRADVGLKDAARRYGNSMSPSTTQSLASKVMGRMASLEAPFALPS